MFHMERKDYKLEIVNTLLVEPEHVRGIANKLGTNHTLIVRKVKDLENENVVDFAREGKNKTYFLKQTAEARELIYMAESYRVIRTLEKYPRLRQIIQRIQTDPQIQLALLFGSYARGTAQKDSDIDVYIETEDRDLRKDLKLLDSKLSVKIGPYDRKSPLIKEIENNHVTLKGIEYFYEKNQFFKQTPQRRQTTAS